MLAAVCALKLGGFERVLVVPVFEHAFHKQLTPFEHRLQMCRLAFEGIAGVEVSALESELETPSLTLRTVEHVLGQHPDWALRLLVGSDVLGDSAKWHAFDRISALAPPFVLARPGYEHPSAPGAVLPDVSSTRVREALARRDQASFLQGAVPRAVLAYIAEHGLYSNGG